MPLQTLTPEQIRWQWEGAWPQAHDKGEHLSGKLLSIWSIMGC